MSSNLLFYKLTRLNGRKTDIFQVANKEGAPLGIICWWPHWRRYCFFPERDNLFDVTCMLDIVDFINKLMAERKNVSK